MRDHTITPPEPHVTLFRCRICKEDMPESYKSRLDSICEDCEWDYIKSKAAELSQDFIAEHKSEFYLAWWFDNLPEDDRLEIAMAAYCQRRAWCQTFYKNAFLGMRKDESEFCLDHMYFADFVRQRS